MHGLFGDFYWKMMDKTVGDSCIELKENHSLYGSKIGDKHVIIDLISMHSGDVIQYEYKDNKQIRMQRLFVDEGKKCLFG